MVQARNAAKSSGKPVPQPSWQGIAAYCRSGKQTVVFLVLPLMCLA